MKKIIFLLNLFLGVMNYSFSQYPPCNQGLNCNPDSYVAPQSQYSFNKGNSGVELVSFMNNGVMCYCEVYYRIKICLSNNNLENKEIYIEKIIFDPNCIPTNKDIAISAAVRMMVKFAPMYFGNPSTVLWGWRVTIATPKCWNLNGYTFEGCYNPECCKTEYFVNKDPFTSQFSITDKNKINVNPNDCGTFSVANCTYHCEANDLPYGPLDNSEIQYSCSETPTCNEQWNDSWQIWNDMYLTTLPEVFETHLSQQSQRLESVDPNSRALGYVSYKKCLTPTSCEHLIKIEKVNLNSFAANDINVTDYNVLFKVIRSALQRANGYFHERMDPNYNRLDQPTTTTTEYQCNNESRFKIKIVFPLCWRRISTWNGVWLVPCTETDCCVVDFRVWYGGIDSLENPNRKRCQKDFADDGEECQNIICSNECSYVNPLLDIWFDQANILPKIILLEDNVLKEDTKNYIFKIKPNPIKNNINIEFLNDYENSKIELSNSSGYIVYKKSLNKIMNWDINTINIINGTYLLNITVDNITKTEKIIIIK